MTVAERVLMAHPIHGSAEPSEPRWRPCLSASASAARPPHPRTVRWSAATHVHRRVQLRQPRLQVDEPASGVDVGTRHELLALLAELNQGGLAVLTTHDLYGIAVRLPNRVALHTWVVATGPQPRSSSRPPAINGSLADGHRRRRRHRGHHHRLQALRRQTVVRTASRYFIAERRSLQACSQRRHASAHTRQCSCMPACLSHSSPQLLHA